MKIDIIVLAAGKGSRMRSTRPKVLHELGGRSLLHHVIATAQLLEPRQIAVVVGYEGDAVRASVTEPVTWVHQKEQLGTAHAVGEALPSLGDDGIVLVLYGDVPLVSLSTLKACCDAALAGRVGLVTAHFDDPAELGRIVRGADGEIQRIVEFRDASAKERALAEINSGIIALPAERLAAWLPQITADNNQAEYYLTDVIALAVADGVAVQGVTAASAAEVTGVNDRGQLAQLERIYQQRQAARLMAQGVTIADPNRLDIRGRVEAGVDCFLDINVVLTGTVKLGNGVRVGPGAVISDSELGDGTHVHAHTVVDGALVAQNCSLGPFARIRPGTRLESGVKIGNFVETKKAHLGAGTKASHLAYLGDAVLGADCNVGAGTVTCNYDGISKHQTDIGDGVFVGTNSTLVAPITIEDGAFVAAGSTVTNTVGAGELAVGRARQRNIKGWVRPDQRRKNAE